MPQRRDKAFADLPGITLFHASRSNCSARVRLLLEEKSLDWHSRLISLQHKENRTPEYFAINPKGLVPSLIHDGWVVTESNDILYYLEAAFPEPGFVAADRAAMDRWLDVSAALHLPGVKTLNYSKLNPAGSSKPPDDIQRYQALQTDPELLQFHAKAGTGFSTDERAQAEALVNDAIGEMDAALAKQDYVAGATYSLADVCWVTTIPTLSRSGFDLTPFPHVRAWYDRIAARPAYTKALTDWETAPR